ncbi:hypothetical protein GDO81_012561 [Engystomops pustulosus]|uniref:Uncharacterized protein n=1 Tax=Engystomops pustulosus TaxID=76066 RepID=A0AAV7BMT7_ENGPU|nr:hypothetical protein GDO81_012561 [Engystomops pustulosus]
MKSLASWLPSLQKNDGEAPEADDEDIVETTFPPYESRITTAKLLIEAEKFERPPSLCGVCVVLQLSPNESPVNFTLHG